jgi:DUF1707 SHOCT-like domain
MHTVYRSPAMDDVRASDSERDAAVSRLGTAAGEGRLTLEEFVERVDRANTAATRAELDGLLAAPEVTLTKVSLIGGVSVRSS